MPDDLVVITGGGTGIGRATALAFAAAGSDVLVAGRTAETLEAVAAEAGALPGAVTTCACDVSIAAGARTLGEAVFDAGRAVSVLVCAAGGNPQIHRPEDVDVPAFEEVERRWDETLRANLSTAVLAVAAIEPHRRRHDSRIVLVGSEAAARGMGGPYAAAKAALEGYARTVAREMGPDGTRVNVVAPGIVPGTAFFPDEMGPEQLEGYARAQALTGGVATPDDVAGTIVWLASPAGGHVTGQVVRVDGGATLGA